MYFFFLQVPIDNYYRIDKDIITRKIHLPSFLCVCEVNPDATQKTLKNSKKRENQIFSEL